MLALELIHQQTTETSLQYILFGMFDLHVKRNWNINISLVKGFTS